MLQFELLTIGNEILQGDVLDTNSHWLCQELTARGARVMRMAGLPDDPAVIGEALRGALARRPDVIVTCGGLGPTVDDLTVAAVGTALGRPLAEDADALALVAALYARLHAAGAVSTGDLSPARRKMAVMPEGGVPLTNSVGAAPGVWLEVADSIVVCLPGVPAEMKAIFTEQVWPRLALRHPERGQPAFVERVIRTNSYDESQMAPAVDAVAARHPQVYVKSRAQVYGGAEADFVTLSVQGAGKQAADALLDAAEADLRAALEDLGVNVAQENS